MGFTVYISRFALPVLAVIILGLCLAALLRRKPQSLGNVQIFNAKTGEAFVLTSRETSLGSHKNCDIRIDDASVSKQHAVIICGKDGWYIKGIRGDSPVFVNGSPADKTELLKAGDKIRLGDITLVFQNKTVSLTNGGQRRNG